MVVKQLNNPTTSIHKRRKKVFTILKKLGTDVKTYDDFIFLYGKDLGLMVGLDKDRGKVMDRLRVISFWEGVIYCIENGVLTDKELLKRLDVSDEVKKGSKGNYIG